LAHSNNFVIPHVSRSTEERECLGKPSKNGTITAEQPRRAADRSRLMQCGSRDGCVDLGTNSDRACDVCLTCPTLARVACPRCGAELRLTDPLIGIAEALQRRLSMSLASQLIRIATGLANRGSNGIVF